MIIEYNHKKLENNFQKTSMNEPINQTINPESFYLDKKVNEEFVVSAVYKLDEFEEATTDALVSIVNQNSFTY